MAQDAYRLPKIRKYTTVFLAYVEKILSQYTGFSDEIMKDGNWYQEEDEEEKEVEALFKEWDESDKEGNPDE